MAEQKETFANQEIYSRCVNWVNSYQSQMGLVMPYLVDSYYLNYWNCLNSIAGSTFTPPSVLPELEDRNSQCPFCFKVFNTVRGKKQHIGKKHDHYRPVSCELCGKNFKHKHAKKAHVVEFHQRKARISCETCGKSLYNKYVLQRHISTFHKN